MDRGQFRWGTDTCTDVTVALTYIDHDGGCCTHRQCLLSCLAPLDRQAGVAASSLAGKVACSWGESRAEKGIVGGRGKDNDTNFKLYERVETQMTNQRQCNHGRWPEANVVQQYRSGPNRLVHQMLRVPATMPSSVLVKRQSGR